MTNLLKWTIKNLVEVIEGCVQNDFDVIVFVEGNRGLGKSTLLYKIGTRLNSRGIVKFNPRKHITYSREDAIKLLATCRRTFILPDEMINVAYGRDFYEQDQKVLLKGLNMYRDSCNVFAGAIPKFIDLDIQMKRLCKIRITVIRRGIAIIQTQLRGINREDPWDTKHNLKIELKNYKKSAPFGKLTTAKGILYFTDLSESQKKEYQSIKREKRNKVYNRDNDLDIEDPREQLYNRLIEEIINFKITQKEFETTCRMTGTSIKSARNQLNERLKNKGLNERLQHFFKETEKKRLDKKKSKKMIIRSNSSDNQEHGDISPTHQSPETLNNNLKTIFDDSWDGL